jgi:pyruvate/2-oxoglutarate dehydrogenase complex dihydrolipoamide dehydrogenase (E3) component
MTDYDYDFCVIGGGSAGYAAARTAAAEGLRTVVVDGAAELGGLCILRGCMPSKTLIESANRALTLRRAAEFGLNTTTDRPSIAAIRQRKRHLIADFAGYRQNQLQDGRFTLHRAHAAFLDPHTIALTGIDTAHGSTPTTLSAASFCIATGSVPNIPPIDGLEETGYWTSDDVLDTDTLPASIIILGGGAIALEMAHYLEAMGTAVIIIQRGKQLLSGLPAQASEVIVKAYEKRGIHCHLGCTATAAEILEDGSKAITFKNTESGTVHQIKAHQILVATGRRPNTAGLKLEAATIHHEKGKILTSASQQSNQAHIFAAGDVSSPLDVVHLAIQQGEIAARNAARLLQKKDGPMEEMDYRLKLFGVFSHPQVAAVGYSADELEAKKIPYRSADYPFDDHGKSMTMGETEGYVQLHSHAETGEILGGLCVGPEATELIHEIVVAMHFRATAAQLAAIPHYHPTLSEIWTYPAEDLI